MTFKVAGVVHHDYKPNPVNINGTTTTGLIQALRLPNINMTLLDGDYKKIKFNGDGQTSELVPQHVLAQISDFTQLAATSHVHGIPVNALEEKHLTYYDEASGNHRKYSGNRLGEMKTRVKQFQKVFANLTNNLLALMNIIERSDNNNSTNSDMTD